MPQSSKSPDDFLSELNTAPRDFLEFLSFVYLARTRKESLSLYSKYLTASGKTDRSVEFWIPQLKSLGWLTVKRNLYQVDPMIVEDVSALTAAAGRAHDYCAFLKKTFYPREKTNLLQARWALYESDLTSFHTVLTKHQATRHRQYQEDYDIIELIGQGVSKPSTFDLLPEEISQLIVKGRLTSSVKHALPCSMVWQWSQEQATLRSSDEFEHQLFLRDLDGLPPDSRLRTLQQILKGDLSGLDSLLSSSSSQDTQLQFPFSSQEFIYVVACYASERLEQVQQHSQLESQAAPTWFSWFWEIRQGKRSDLSPELLNELSHPDTSAITRFFAYLLLFWAGFREPLNPLDLAHLGKAYREAGYLVLARELESLKAWVDSKNDDSLTPFLGLLSPTELWKSKLARLQDWTKSAEPPSPRSTSERLIWFFQPSPLRVTAKIQTMKKSGDWSRGREVQIHDIAEKAEEFLTHQDREVLEAWNLSPRNNDGKKDKSRVLQALIGHPLLHLPNYNLLTLSLSSPRVLVEDKGENLRVSISPKREPFSNFGLLELEPDHFAFIAFTPEQIELEEILGKDGLLMPAKATESVQALLSRVAEMNLRVESFCSASENVETRTNPVILNLRLTPQNRGLAMQVTTSFEGQAAAYHPCVGPRFLLLNTDHQAVQLERDFEKERELYHQLQEVVPEVTQFQAQFLGPGECLSLLERLRLLPGENFVLQWPEGKKFQESQEVSWSNLRLSLSGSKDWFEVDSELQLEGMEHIKLATLLAMQSEQKSRFIELDDGKILTLSETFSKQLRALESASAIGKDGRYKLNRLTATVLLESMGFESEDRLWQEQLSRLQSARNVEPTVPSSFRAELRPYQKRGFEWLTRSAAWGVGVCLADDMGLGKTVQILALLLDRASRGPALVIAPTSVCSNWKEEAQRFAPSLRVLILGEGDREETVRGMGPYDVLVCSYGLMCTTLDLLMPIVWDTLVLDESQAIKNNQTQRFKAAVSLQANFRVAATGTPVENHLGELWALFRFLNPGLLGPQRTFASRYGGTSDSHEILKDLLAPFILRRLKSDVLKDLPAKTDITIKVELSREERLFYESLRLGAIERMERQGQPAVLGVLAELMKIRRACCNPRLIDPSSTIPSSKMERFAELIEDLHEGGHKVLVFSQFVSHLKLLEEEVQRLGLTYEYLDGSTSRKRRSEAVKNFQAGERDVFLISLKAGGTGLNLTAANYVIHMDPWWNPATEDQASDRAHRIGQTKSVTVYRLIGADTIEEKILALHEQKRELVDNLLAGTDRAGKLSADELLQLLKESAFSGTGV